jgi:hypothetical protein
VVDKDLECLRKTSLDFAVMWTHHLPLPRPAICEEIRLQKLAAAKKMLNAFQLKNSPHVPVGTKKKQKTKNGNPELPTICEDVPPNCSAPAPAACEDALPASVPSPDIGIKSHKKLAYEAFPVINWETVVKSRKNDLEGDALNMCNKTKDFKERKLQLEKKVQILLAEKEAMQLSREELEKKLELSEARLLQSSSQLQQTLAAMLILQEEKERSAQEILTLKITLEELRGQLDEPLPPQPPAGPTAAEQQLEEETRLLRKALECLEGQLGPSEGE